MGIVDALGGGIFCEEFLMSGRLLVTGGSGFVGRALLNHFSRLAVFDIVVAPMRGPGGVAREGVKVLEIGGIDGQTDWSESLVGVSHVIHCAARVHVMHEDPEHSRSQYRKVNVDGTFSLASQAALHGVKRFVFVSSIKVNGEMTLPDRPYDSESEPSPQDNYGWSKWEAEQKLLQLSRETSMEVVIVRPVLVYGPGVKANFLSLLKWLDRGIPLPLGGLSNRRSFLNIDNLVDFIHLCLNHPDAANQTFLVSDGQDVSLPQLLAMLSRGLGRVPRTFSVPPVMIRLAASMLGRVGSGKRLTESLTVDISKNRDLLGWTPPVPLELGLQRVAEHYREHHKWAAPE